MKRRTTKEQELADRSRLAHAWRKWHAEQLKAALEGVHGAVLERLMAQLKDLHSARELVDFIAAQNWNAVDAETRQAALHEIGIAICQLRERAGLEPFDDGLPGEPDNAFRRIKSTLSFPSHNGVAAFERRKLP